MPVLQMLLKVPLHKFGMELTFLGGAREVGRSSVLLESDARLLLDYGIKIHADTAFPMPHQGEIDAAVISHAHLDHSGFVPALYDADEPMWIATPPTRTLCEILLPDCARILQRERGGLPYKHGSLNAAFENFNQLGYGQSKNIHNTRISFHDAGHIAGSAIVEIEHKKKRVVYTGDFKLSQTRMHEAARPIKEAQALIMESTYFDREHPTREEIERDLCNRARDVMENGGNLLLPAFAVGRTQELIRVFRAHMRDAPIYVDGMGWDASNAVAKHANYIRNAKLFKKDIESVRHVRTRQEREKVLKEPCIVIASAGMLQGGPAMSYLLTLNAREDADKSKVVFTGYCEIGTNGHKLLNTGIVDVGGQPLPIKIPYEYLDLSAHAGRQELFSYVSLCAPEKVFCMHGDKPDEFAEELKLEGYDAIAPKIGERFEI